MSEFVHTNVEVLGSLREGVDRLVNEAGDAAVAVNQVMRQVQSQMATTLAGRQGEVNRLVSELDRCRRTPGDPPPNCAPIAAALAAAQRRLADARQAARIAEQALHAHAAARARLEHEMQALASQGRNTIAAHLGQLAVYLAVDGAVGGGSSGAGSAATVGSGVGTASALGSLAVGHLIDEPDSPVHGPEDFGSGDSSEEVTS